MNAHLLIRTLGFLMISPWMVLGQEIDSTRLTLDRIYASREFSGARFGPTRWIDDGSGYTTLERSEGPAGGRDIVRYETESGERRILVPAERLIPEGGSTPLSIENYDWSPDGHRLLVFTNSQRVWRMNTRGDYWVLDMSSFKLKKLGGAAAPSTLMFAKFSPDGSRVAYVRENNLYVEDLAGGDITQLTRDGSRTTINGTFDWVYEEEFDLRDGFRWSPDGSRIAYWQLDATGVRDFLLINNTDSLYSYVIPVQYPKAGTTLSACRVGVVVATGGPTTWFQGQGDPRNNYIPRMDWAGNSDEIAFQYMNRLQDTNRVILADVHSGAMRTVLIDSDSTWVEVVNDMYWTNGGKNFTWLSEADGWNHLYKYSRDGSMVRLLSPGKFDIIHIEHVDKGAQWVYFMASPDNPTQRYLYRMSLEGNEKMSRVTPSEQAGSHRYNISPNGRWAIHTYSTFTTPSVVDLVSLPDHRRVRVLADNKAIRRSIDRLAQGTTRFFRIDVGGGLVLDGWMMLPVGFDSTKRYPLLQSVYGEPAAQTVLDGWGGSTHLWDLMLTQKGYIVLSIDNRGTPAPRGRQWRKCIFKKIGSLASDDLSAAMSRIRHWPFVDSSRIAIWGWSGGGSMTLHMLFRHPELYQTGMSVAPVPDVRLYDAIYQERYLGLPADNPEPYRTASAITYADNLQGNLLVVHGTGDDNVHFQGTERLINALVKANKQFSMMAYPNRSHGIFEGENTTRHLFGLLTKFLYEHTPPGPMAR